MLRCNKPTITLLFFALIAPTFSKTVLACPLVGGLVDFNCDQIHKVAVTGDSIVAGRGDTTRSGGYVSRLADRFSSSTVVGAGFPGITSTKLLASLKRLLLRSKDTSTKRKLNDADLLIIDVGRNDFFELSDPAFTVRDIRRIVKFLRQELNKDYDAPPLIAVATLLPTTRGFQRSFIIEVNKLLLAQKSEQLPVYLRFDQVDDDLISGDGIHPSSAGYKSMSNIASSFIRGEAQKLSRARRSDDDDDGVYDRLERTRFGIDPSSPDTDADGLNDGAELFTYTTDPLLADTDADGKSDGEEVEQGTNPLSSAE